MTYRESLAVLSPAASWCPAVGRVTTLLCVAHTHRGRRESGVDGTSLEVVRGSAEQVLCVTGYVLGNRFFHEVIN